MSNGILSGSFSVLSDSKRALFRLNIACDASVYAIQAAAVRIVTGACEITAGGTMFPITGGWAKDGSLDLKRFSGPFNIEPGVGIELTVPEDRVDELYTALKSIVPEACHHFELPVEWVHTDIVIRGVRRAAHFQIDKCTSAAGGFRRTDGEGCSE